MSTGCYFFLHGFYSMPCSPILGIYKTNFIYLSRIRINLLPSRRSSSRSPGSVSVSHLHWATPEPSPLSSYTTILRSPIPPYIRPPLVRPILSASPGKSMVNSQGRFAGLVHSSPSPHRVCQKLIFEYYLSV